MKSKLSRLLSLVMVLALSLSFCGFFDAQDAYAKSKKKKAPDPVNVYVTINDNTGKVVFRQVSVEVTDIDKDGVLTINDALYNAHEKKYDGGAAAGYGYATSDWGLYVTKLWGDESGWFGYYKNSEYSSGLSDTVDEGDYIDAFCYSDTKKHSDKYTFFNKRVIEVHRNEEFTLKLSYMAYDKNYNLVTGKVKNAVIVDGSKETEYTVNKKGVVKLSFDKIGTHFVSANSTRSKTVLVHPACIVHVLPNKGNLITPDKSTGIQYKVIESGSILNNERGIVEVYKNENRARVPNEITYGGVMFEVK